MQPPLSATGNSTLEALKAQLVRPDPAYDQIFSERLGDVFARLKLLE
jgi:hypothetical protein